MRHNLVLTLVGGGIRVAEAHAGIDYAAGKGPRRSDRSGAGSSLCAQGSAGATASSFLWLLSFRSDGHPARLFVVDRLRRRGEDVELIDAKAVNLPMLDRMYKEYPKGHAPEALEQLARKIRNADGFVFVTGEYNWGIQPGLKNLRRCAQSTANKRSTSNSIQKRKPDRRCIAQSDARCAHAGRRLRDALSIFLTAPRAAHSRGRRSHRRRDH